MKNKKLAYLTQTAIMLALLIAVQFATRSLSQFLPGTLVVGSLVNMILLVSTFMVGLGGGLTIALVSPFLALLAGMGPVVVQIVPVIAIGNAVLVLIAHFVRKEIVKNNAKGLLFTALGLIAASAAKMAVLWIGVVLVVLPLIPGIPAKQAEMIGTMFTWPQLVTALGGSVLTTILVPLLKKIMKK